MRVFDLIDLCFRNLTRRKVRTLLTVTGVVVGTCAIVVMISLGIGMNEIMEQSLAQMGDLKMIQVYNYNSSSENIIDDAKVAEWKALPGVVVATPMYETWQLNIEFSAGSNRKYCTNSSIIGVYPEALQELGFELKEGDYFLNSNKDTLSVVVGEKWGYDFYNTRGNDSNRYVDESMLDANGNPKPPFVDVMKDKIDATLVVGGEDAKQIKKKVLVCGKIKEDYSKGYQTSRGVFMDIKELKRLEEEYRKLGNEKKKKDTGYQTVSIKVEDIKYIEDVEKVIKEDGFETSSLESIRKPLEEQARQQQAVLGGLGGISLFVAAIGITNTMIMSIYERTREIGVMKALGCYVRDIRKIFLLEAGTIGFVGGVTGVIISYGISFLINHFGLQAGGNTNMMVGDMASMGAKTSIIPLWLVVLAIVFSTLIGLISGYYPANRAVKISALEAIRGE